MRDSQSQSYKEAGVNIEAGYEVVARIQKHIKNTMGERNSFDHLGFGGLLPLNVSGMSQPLLVSATDGVGTKLKLAFLLDRHDTVGVDCVAMCVNDVLCVGAVPINFLDYIACGKNIPTKIEQIVKGITDGCLQAGIPLVGGETAEMPGFYPEDEYDLAGFCNGIVDQSALLDKNDVREGDVVIAIASSGVHSNGFSLVRKIFNINDVNVLEQTYAALDGQRLGDVLLTPTKIYVKPVTELLKKNLVKSLAHITGGGFYENIPRSLPAGYGVVIKRSDVEVLPIFSLIQQTGAISDRDMFNTFNMGVGMTCIVSPDDVDQVLDTLTEHGEHAYVLGRVVRSETLVELL
ncbi:phosphoribosylformylglycinamidine cyclo-ligase [Arcanobacterium pinnipediorum]|uniref:Phosphoribosylformylglycinamidine cyclo-ligase n=1 Tax=Arcanobacterium pinnipediorum TaxID=1503041 RepID=A0ABY5AJJ4_9ACTO|nr:phosphoribosylformylglycinamidine cyclo-ligase [Arcanobacterium pinnipediorum]USR80136.1 phosphoribosylformylglycinamidine cyclo-ligase [Arcanobacterium pinnipediorum]